MAKSFVKKSSGPPGEKEARVSYPSPCGSHASMIDEEATSKLDDPTKVICKDANGLYETDRNRLDTRLADPNRHDMLHRIKMGQKRPELKYIE